MQITDFKFNDLLPESIKNAPTIKALCESIDVILKENRVNNLLIYSRIDELDEAILDDLAWQFNIDFWKLATTISQKRAVIKNAIQSHWHKGTRFALEQIGVILDMPITVTEWFEDTEEEPELRMQPFQFSISVDTSSKGAYQDLEPDIMRLVNSLKNVRSQLVDLTQKLSVEMKLFTTIVPMSVNVNEIVVRQGTLYEYYVNFESVEYGNGVLKFYFDSEYENDTAYIFMTDDARLIKEYEMGTEYMTPELFLDRFEFIDKKRVTAGSVETTINIKVAEPYLVACFVDKGHTLKESNS